MEMQDPGEPRLSGRRAQARRNDPRIREAAREVFTAHPDAPMSAVTARAGVGISALYRRYANKEDLLRQVARDGLQQYLEIAEAAVADERDAWTTFEDFMARLLDAQKVAITMNLAGTFAPDEELYPMSVRANELNEAILLRTKRKGGLRRDVVVDDLSLILEQVSTIRLGDVKFYFWPEALPKGEPPRGQGRTAPTRRDELVFSAKVTTPRGVSIASV